MFTIDKLLQEIIAFIKSFFRTFFVSLFKPLKLFTNNDLSMLMRPSIYMVISMFLYFGFLTLNPFTELGADITKTIKKYLEFYDKASLENNILYVLPISLSLYLGIYVIGKAMFMTVDSLKILKRSIYYGIGNSMILMALFDVLIIAVYNQSIEILEPFRNSEVFSGPEPVVSALLSAVIFYLPPGVILIALILLRKSVDLRIWLRYLFIPVLIWYGEHYCLASSAFLGQLFDVNESPVELFSERGDKNILFTLECQTNSCNVVSAKTRLYVYNVSKVNFIIRKPDSLSLQSEQNDRVPGTYNSFVINYFQIDRIDDDVTKSFKVLEPGKTVTLDISDKDLSKNLNYWFSISSKGVNTNNQLGWLLLKAPSFEDASYELKQKVQIYEVLKP